MPLVLAACAGPAAAQFVSPTAGGTVIANIFRNNVPIRDNSSSIAFPPGYSVYSSAKIMGSFATALGEARCTTWNSSTIAGTLSAASTIVGFTGGYSVNAQSEANVVIDFQLSSARDIELTVNRSVPTAQGNTYVNAALDSVFPFTEGSSSFTRVFHCNPGFHRLVVYARTNRTAQGTPRIFSKVSATFVLRVVS